MTDPASSGTELASEDITWGPTPLPALELPEIPSELHFVRSHFPVPTIDLARWKLRVVGTGDPCSLGLEELRALPRRTLRVVLECAGHRRTEMDPLPPGLPWGCGAVAEARWTGPTLASVLELAGIPPGTSEVVLEGADAGRVESMPGTHCFARSLPLGKALHRDVLLAYEMNGEPITVDRGGPVRAVVPGWYATDAVKWLAHVWFSSAPFDGPFQAHDYLLLEPGEAGVGRRMTELPVHAVITKPTGRERQPAGRWLVRGIAWGGRGGIARVQIRVDRGPWRRARLAPARGRYARTAWELPCMIPAGEHELACLAVDGEGNAQPDQPPRNVGGYANNAVHRVTISAT